jgi:hypothetical protein
VTAVAVMGVSQKKKVAPQGVRKKKVSAKEARSSTYENIGMNQRPMASQQARDAARPAQVVQKANPTATAPQVEQPWSLEAPVDVAPEAQEYARPTQPVAPVSMPPVKQAAELIVGETINLYCSDCKQWFMQESTTPIYGTETCGQCGKPLVAVLKCTSCGQVVMLPLGNLGAMQANPEKCQACGSNYKIV